MQCSNDFYGQNETLRDNTDSLLKVDFVELVKYTTVLCPKSLFTFKYIQITFKII